MLLIALERPRTSPKIHLTFFLTAGTIEAAYIINRDAYAISNLFTFQLAAAAALLGCMVSLTMPFRPPALPCVDISAVGQAPSSDFRSPEDNLRPWHFFTVSWMAPLMAVGKDRQLDEGDVWYLPFEFQHKRLHEKFRQLRGSVIGRLLRANGIDVLIISTISIVQMTCGMTVYPHTVQMLNAYRIFDTVTSSATPAGNEGREPVQPRGISLRNVIIGASLCGCPIPGIQPLVWQEVLRAQQR